MPGLEPVDHDPFTSSGSATTIRDNGKTYVVMDMGGGAKLEPVDHDPFAADLGGLAKAGGIGVAKGAIGLAGLPGDAGQLLKKGVDWVSDKLPEIPTNRVAEWLRSESSKVGPGAASGAHGDMPGTYDLPTSHDIQGQIEKVTGKFREPQNQAERDAETVGEFAPAALMGPGGIARKVITQDAIPAAANIAAGRYSDQNPYVKALAGLVAGVGASTAFRPGQAAETLRRQLPDFVTEAHITRAGNLIEAAKNRGINLTWPEALSKVTGQPVLTDMQRILESHPRSRTHMQTVMADRPNQVQNGVLGELDNLGGYHPNPSSIGPEAGKAATDVLGDVRGKINKASEPYYKAAEAQLFTPAEFKVVQTVPGFKESLEAVRNAPDAWRVAHLPDNSVGVLDKVKQHFDQMAKNAGSKFNPQQNKSVQSSHEMSARAVKEMAIAKSGEQAALHGGPNNYQVALDVQTRGREILDTLLKGPLGQLAKKDPTTKRAIDALFPVNPLPNSEGEIRNAVFAIAQKRPAVAEQLVRAHAEMVFNDAAKALQGGANQFAGAKFAVRIAGNAQQRANLQAAIEALPHGNDRWRGLNNLLDILEATGTRQPKGSLTAFNSQELKAMEGGGAADLATIAASPGKWWTFANDKYKSWALGQNLDELARIITNPRSGNALKTISRIPVGSGRAEALAGRLILQLGASTTEPRAKPN